MKTYTTKTAAEYLNCHEETVREYIRKGKLLASRPGKRYCIRQSALDDLLNQLENDAVQASLASRSEKLCQSSNETTHGTLIFASQAVSALDARLEQRTRKPPKNCTIN
ncbi:helix-turn-helix domain-containing protein [Glaesserella sp.]|uniref:helix-turn-helix domain-containing protein n=1 Tax=Glaesserella sp. TaxID=2094731 RepID=UPI00359F83DE